MSGGVSHNSQIVAGGIPSSIGSGISARQIRRMQSDVLSLPQMQFLAREILRDGDYIKTELTIPALAMPWLNLGDFIAIKGNIMFTQIDESGTKTTKIIAMDSLVDGNLYVDGQDFATTPDSNTGTLRLVGYLY